MKLQIEVDTKDLPRCNEKGCKKIATKNYYNGSGDSLGNFCDDHGEVMCYEQEFYYTAALHKALKHHH